MMANRVPITRISKFFGEKDFDLNISMGEEWLLGDMNFTLVLYRVDRFKTNQDNVYGEALTNSISYLPPVEIKAYVKIEGPTQATFGESKLSQSEPGNLIMSVYLKYLEQEGIDINYGDYIGYPETESRMRYYSVADDGRVISDNKHTYGGYKPFYRTIVCTPVSEDEFNGI
jgi:hypothetical protein